MTPAGFWLLLAVGLPLAAAAVVGAGASPRAVGTGTTAVVAAVALSCFPGRTPVGVTWPGLLPGTVMSLRVDALSWTLSALAALLWLLAAVYSLGYLHGGARGRRFWVFLLVTLGGAQGAFLAGDVFTLFLCFEVMSLSAYFLVVHDDTPAARRAGTKYLYLSVCGGLALFVAVLLTYTGSGTLQLTRLNHLGPGAQTALYCYLAAFGLKAGLVPFHVWLPDAHPVAPSPASALLSGIMIKAGAYGLFRVVFWLYGPDAVRALGGQVVLFGMAVASMTLGSVAAVLQQEVKRRLAYSSIAQMGYVALGLGLLSPAGLAAAVYHTYAHAGMKSLLFLAGGVMLWTGERRRVSDWRGAGRAAPLAAACFTLGALGMVGIPPLTGFVGKWELGVAATAAGRLWPVALLVASGLANAAYYLPLVNLAYFANDGHAHGEPAQEAARIPTTMALPLVLLALITLSPLWAGPWLLDLVRQAVTTLGG